MISFGLHAAYLQSTSFPFHIPKPNETCFYYHKASMEFPSHVISNFITQHYLNLMSKIVENTMFGFTNHLTSVIREALLLHNT